jgi:hypothetical protein
MGATQSLSFIFTSSFFTQIINQENVIHLPVSYLNDTIDDAGNLRCRFFTIYSLAPLAGGALPA